MPKKDRVLELLESGRMKVMVEGDNFAWAVVDSKDGYYDTIIKDDLEICTCKSFIYRRTCSHVKALRTKISFEEVITVPKLMTLNNNINTFFEGGIPLGDMILICGLPAVGKSLYGYELTCCYLASYRDKNALLILTEERAKNTLNIVLDRYSRKYNLKVKQAEWFVEGDEKVGKQGTKMENVVKEFVITKNELKPDIGDDTGYLITAFIPNLYDIMTLIGKPGVFTTPDVKDEKGYQRWRDLPGGVYHCQKSILAQFIERYNIGWVMTDSITQPVKAEWVLSQSNFPARQQVYAKWLGRYMQICSYFDVTMINIGHGVPRGAMDFSTTAEEKVWGGVNVMHSHKYIIRIRRMPRRINKVEVPDYNAKRRFYLDRWGTKEDNRPDTEGNPEYVVLKITDEGFIDPLEEGKKLPVPKKVTKTKKKVKIKRS